MRYGLGVSRRAVALGVLYRKEIEFHRTLLHNGDLQFLSAYNIELSCPANHRTAATVHLNDGDIPDRPPRGQLQRLVMSNPTFSLHYEFSSSSWSILSVLQYFPELPRLNNGDISMRAEDQEILIACDDVVNRSLFC